MVKKPKIHSAQFKVGKTKGKLAPPRSLFKRPFLALKSTC